MSDSGSSRTVSEGVKQGWLDRGGLAEACRSFGNAPATSTHPSGARRCANLDRCFAAASAMQQRQQEKAILLSASATRSVPQLVSGPTLVRGGLLR